MRVTMRTMAAPLSVIARVPTRASRPLFALFIGICAPTRVCLHAASPAALSPAGRGTRYSKLGMDGFTDVGYNAVADAFLERVEGALEEVDSSAIEDVSLLGGVLTIETVARGTFVLNKQAPNVQIWLSSPLSGPHHYDMIVGDGEGVEGTRWVADTDGHTLKERLEQELTEVLKVNVKL